MLFFLEENKLSAWSGL